MTRKLRAGVIGLGNIGFRYSLDRRRTWVSSHLAAYQEHPAFECVAVCDTDQGRVEEARRVVPQAEAFRDWRDMLYTYHLDALSVCVSPEFNETFCLGPLPSIPRVVLFEKPLARDQETGGAMVAALRAQAIEAAVHHYQRWQPPVLRAREIIRSGGVGRMRHAAASWGGGLWSDGIHALDLIRFLGGEFREIQGLQVQAVAGAEDFIVSAYGRLENEAEVWLRAVEKEEAAWFEVDMVASSGRLILSDHGRRLRHYRRGPSLRFSNRKEWHLQEEIRMGPEESHFSLLLDELAAFLTGRRQDLTSSAQDGLEAVRLAGLILESSPRKVLTTL